MTWFKVDDGLAFHSKVVQAGNPAMGLWVRAGSWSAQQLTDGFVPDHIVSTLGTKAQAKALAEARLWERAEGGYQFHGWNEEGRQPTREAVEKERAEARERMRKAREAGRGSGDVRANTGRTSGAVRSARPGPVGPGPKKGVERDEGVTEVDARTRPPRCHLHLHLKNSPPCGPCKELRIAWENEKPALSLVPKGLECDIHRGQLAGNCSGCAADRKAIA